MTRVAILDDYQNVALGMADWKSLPADTEVVVFEDHLADQGALAERLAGFDVVMAMRERLRMTAIAFSCCSDAISGPITSRIWPTTRGTSISLYHQFGDWKSRSSQ